MFSKVTALLALCVAVSAQGFGSIAVQTQNGHTVVINQNTQRQVHIATNPTSTWGTQTIKIQVAGPAISPKNVQIADQQVDPTGTQESDILNQILEEFNGYLDEETFQQLIGVTAQQVAIGKVDPIVLDALQTASNDERFAQSKAQKLIRNVIRQKQGSAQGQWQQGLTIPGKFGQQGWQQVKQAQISQAIAQAGNPLAGLGAEQLAEQLMQDEISQRQGGFQGQWKRRSSIQRIADLQRTQQTQQIKQQLLSQGLDGGDDTLSTVQADLEAEQAAQASGLTGPERQVAKQIIKSQILKKSGNPLAAAQAELKAKQVAQAWGIAVPESQTTGQIWKSQILGRSGNPLAAAQVELEAEQTAKALGTAGPEKEVVKQVLKSQILKRSGHPIAAAQAELEAEQIAQALRVAGPRSGLAGGMGGSVTPLSPLGAGKTAQLLAEIENQDQFGVDASSSLAGLSKAGTGRLSRRLGVYGQNPFSSGASQAHVRDFNKRVPMRGHLAKMLGMSETDKQTGASAFF